MTTPAHVWVIEMKNKELEVFEPCSEAHIVRSNARREIDYYWRYNYPADKFRIQKYVRESDLPRRAKATAKGTAARRTKAKATRKSVSLA